MSESESKQTLLQSEILHQQERNELLSNTLEDRNRLVQQLSTIIDSLKKTMEVSSNEQIESQLLLLLQEKTKLAQEVTTLQEKCKVAEEKLVATKSALQTMFEKHKVLVMQCDIRQKEIEANKQELDSKLDEIAVLKKMLEIRNTTYDSSTSSTPNGSPLRHTGLPLRDITNTFVHSPATVNLSQYK